MGEKDLKEAIEEVLKSLRTPVTPRIVANRVVKRLKNG